MSGSSVNLAQCDFILSKLIENLNNQTSEISKTLRISLIKRINSRRTIWSDLCLLFNFPESICNKSHFFVKPNANQIIEAINYIIGKNEIETSNINSKQSIICESGTSNLDYNELVKMAGQPITDKVCDSTIQALEYWLNHGIKSPIIEKFSKTVMGIRPTSIDSERCFSVCNRIITPLRNRLDSHKLNTIVFLYENRHN